MIQFDEEVKKLLIKHKYAITVDSKQFNKDGLIKTAKINVTLPATQKTPSKTLNLRLQFNRGLINLYVNGKNEFSGIDENMFGVVWHLPILEWCHANGYPYNPLHWDRKSQVDQSTLPHLGIIAAMEFYSIVNGIDARTLLTLRYLEQFNLLAAHPKYGNVLLSKMKACLEPKPKLPSEVYLEKKWMDDQNKSKTKEMGDSRIESNLSPVTFPEEADDTEVQVITGSDE